MKWSDGFYDPVWHSVCSGSGHTWDNGMKYAWHTTHRNTFDRSAWRPEVQCAITAPHRPLISWSGKHPKIRINMDILTWNMQEKTLNNEKVTYLRIGWYWRNIVLSASHVLPVTSRISEHLGCLMIHAFYLTTSRKKTVGYSWLWLPNTYGRQSRKAARISPCGLKITRLSKSHRAVVGCD